MAKIKQELINEGRGQHEWSYLPLCEGHILRKLIENRIKLDSAYQMKIYETDNPITSNGVPIFEEPIICTYMDLDSLIENCKLTKMQSYVVDQQMRGYAQADIADNLGLTRASISMHFTGAVKRLIESNNQCSAKWLSERNNTE